MIVAAPVNEEIIMANCACVSSSTSIPNKANAIAKTLMIWVQFTLDSQAGLHEAASFSRMLDVVLWQVRWERHGTAFQMPCCVGFLGNLVGF